LFSSDKNSGTKGELLFVMTVYDGEADSDVILNQRVYNLYFPDNRDKVGKTMWWCMHNGHEMILRPLDKGEDPESIEVVGRDGNRESRYSKQRQEAS